MIQEYVYNEPNTDFLDWDYRLQLQVEINWSATKSNDSVCKNIVYKYEREENESERILTEAIVGAASWLRRAVKLRMASKYMPQRRAEFLTKSFLRHQ